MFGFPVNLQDNGVQKFTNDADNGFPKIQQREVFYSVKDGDFEDPSTWQTASGRVGKSPGPFDDVYIRNTIRIVGSYAVNNMYFNGAWNQAATNRILTINGNLINYSTFQWTSGSSSVFVYGSCISYGTIVMSNYNLNLFGEYNLITKDRFVPGTGTIGYYRMNNQVVLDLPYYNLVVWGDGFKTLENNLVVSNTFSVRPLTYDQLTTTNLIFDIGDYDFTINGTSFITGTLRRSTNKKLLFVGGVTFQSVNPKICIDFNGNPEVEFRGGIGWAGANSFLPMNSGTGKWRFTTNNQSISMHPSLGLFLTLDAQVEIEAGITLTQATGKIQLNNTINGISGTSRLVNNGTITFATAASVPSMTTGTWDFTTSANTIEYSGNYTATIPSYFTTFHNLTISGTGTKSLGVNTTLNGNLVTGGVSGCVFELLSYNLVVNGTTTNNVGTFSKNGPGSILFVGNYNTPNTNNCVVSFTGNPSVECRNGFYLGGNFGTCNPGTGTWSFTTNNQDIRNVNTSVTFNNIFIANDITLNIAANGGGTNDTQFTYPVIISNSINGGNANSKFVNKYVTYLGSSTTSVMTTGILDITTFTNCFGFVFNGNHTIPYTTFHTLYLFGSGTKTLSNNTTLNGNLVLQNTTFELSTYNLTITGTTSHDFSTFSKNGAGNILFNGNYRIQDTNGTIVSFTGNPTIEFRNGFNIGNNYHTLNFGNGAMSFTTNNQSFASTSAITYTFNNNILISGAITLTMSTTASLNIPIFTGTINGDSANSKLLMNTNALLNYQNATQPMITGILDTSTNLNTWIYGSGNQDIKGGPTTLAKQVYRNLTLNGGGTKTLQGYVSVQNTYTLTAPATLNNNGFTLTNP